MNKTSVSIFLSVFCIISYAASLMLVPHLIGFVPNVIFIIKLIICFSLAIPAIVISIISRKQLIKIGKSTRFATTAFAISLTSIFIVSGLIYSEFQNNHRIKNNALILSTKALIQNICVSFEVYKHNCGAYPQNDVGFQALISASKATCISKPLLSAKTQFTDSWNNPIIYQFNSDFPIVNSAGTDLEHGTKDDINCSNSNI